MKILLAFIAVAIMAVTLVAALFATPENQQAYSAMVTREERRVRATLTRTVTPGPRATATPTPDPRFTPTPTPDGR